MEEKQKVLVSASFLTTTHGKMSCVECHAGSAGNDRKTAHQNMVAKPSAGKNANCVKCHAKIANNFPNSLHYNNNGIVSTKVGVILPRANPQKMNLLEQGLKTNCGSCHVQTCGECHIGRPATTGGGFVDGHNFYKTPKSVLNCTACHGSRLEKEYMGKAAEDYPELNLQPDVHWLPKSMQCTDCHKGSWMHNEAGPYPNRYEDKEAPSCEGCHAKDSKFTGVASHTKHAGVQTGATSLQCQVCHAQSYNNCYGCHVGKDKKGLPYYKTDKSEFNFKIGRNPDKTKDRPYDYIIVRHVPVARDTFKFYGDDILSNFDALPTWKYATPHTIQKLTPQAKDCNSCHGNAKLFLTDKDVLPDEKKANEKVIVTKIPAKK